MAHHGTHACALQLLQIGKPAKQVIFLKQTNVGTCIKVGTPRFTCKSQNDQLIFAPFASESDAIPKFGLAATSGVGLKSKHLEEVTWSDYERSILVSALGIWTHLPTEMCNTHVRPVS